MRKQISISNIILLVIVMLLATPMVSVAADYTINPCRPDTVTGGAAIVIEEEKATTVESSIPATASEYVDTYDCVELSVLISECKKAKEDSHNMAEAARELGYSEEHPVIVLAQAEYKQANENLKKYQERYEQALILWEEKTKEYPVAAQVWMYLKQQGFNNYVCSGIIGNMMTECGGQTLALSPSAIDKAGIYYGLCQWRDKYYPAVWGLDTQGQLEFLMGNIEECFATYGRNYRKGFGYSDFLNLTDETDAALAFAKVYERCSSASYKARQRNATKALEYFVNK